ncbi:hypothetical protein WJX81_007112 [Elliptochloris bilobata]|uniref:1-phosphatidylinositol-4-phosphate 5-kinase n=1 Tax=Elliptochloris bilobata TaxID=381761 RepID=A0AAW1SJU5_9CHLO
MGTAEGAAGAAPAGGSAPITPETQSPARRPPSAVGGKVPGLPGQQARLPLERPIGGGAPSKPATLAAEGESPTLGPRPAAAERVPVASPVADGRHHAHWPDGSEYYGEWRGGKAHGRGAFVWPSGDRYEGEWADGRENGVGTAIGVDGSRFYGSWQAGKLHGKGVYKPATPQNRRAEVMTTREYADGQLRREEVLRVADYDLRRKAAKRDARRRLSNEGPLLAEEAREDRLGEPIAQGHRSYELMRSLQLGIVFSIARTSRAAAPAGPAPEPTAADFAEQVTQYFPQGERSAAFKWKDYSPQVFQRLRGIFGIDNKDYLLSLTGSRALRELPSPGKSGSVFYLSDDERFLVKTVSREEARLLLARIPAYFRHCAAHPGTLLTRFYGVHRVKSLGGRLSPKVRLVVMGNVFQTEALLHRKFDLKGSTHGRTAGARVADPAAVLKDLDVDVRLALPERAHAALMAQIAADTGLLQALHVMDYSLLLGLHFPRWGAGWFPPHSAPAAGAIAPAPASSAVPGPEPRSNGAATPSGAGHSAAHATVPAVIVGGLAANVDHEPKAAGAPGLHVRGSIPRVSEADEAGAGWGARYDDLLHRAATDARASDDGGSSAADTGEPPEDGGGLGGAAMRRTLSVELGLGAYQRSQEDIGWVPRAGLGGAEEQVEGEPAQAALGVALKASALPRAGGGLEPAICFFGIIDFLQDYNLRKRAEHLAKSVVSDQLLEVNAAATAAIGDTVYLAGGRWCNSTSTNTLLAYNTSSDTWKRLVDLPGPGRNHFPGVALDGLLYVLGGRTVPHPVKGVPQLDRVDVYDPATDSWSSRAQMPTPRSGSAGGVVAGSIVMAGGEGNFASLKGVFPQTEIYNPATDSWSTGPDMAAPRHGTYGIGYKDCLYIPGGGAHMGGLFATNTLEVFYKVRTPACLERGATEVSHRPAVMKLTYNFSTEAAGRQMTVAAAMEGGAFQHNPCEQASREMAAIKDTIADLSDAPPSVHLDVAKGFDRRVVLLTGAAGYVGSVVLEQLFRTCPGIRKVYVFVRSKPGASAAERLAELLAGPAFDALRDSIASVAARIVLIEADISEQGIGLSDMELQALRDGLRPKHAQLRDVDYVIHCASAKATDMPIKDALHSIYLPTRALLHLASALPRVRAFTHLSTAFVNSWMAPGSVAEERVYPLAVHELGQAEGVPLDGLALAERLLSMTDQGAQAEALRIMKGARIPSISYLAKNLAERLVMSYQDKPLSVCIVRPSMIMGAERTPSPGYVGKSSGITRGFLGAAIGVLRFAQHNFNSVAAVVPGDVVSSVVLAASVATAERAGRPSLGPIYHACTSTTHPRTLGMLYEACCAYLNAHPLAALGWAAPRVYRIDPVDSDATFRARCVALNVKLSAMAAMLRIDGQGLAAKKLELGWALWKELGSRRHDYNLAYATSNAQALQALLGAQEAAVVKCVFSEALNDSWEHYFSKLGDAIMGLIHPAKGKVPALPAAAAKHAAPSHASVVNISIQTVSAH